MRLPFAEILVLSVLLLVPQVFARNTCGTVRAIQNMRHLREKPELARVDQSRILPCSAESFYDSVYSRKTEHFQIFYTLSGPNQATEEFIDSVAVNAEFAYRFHTKTLGMLPPLGVSSTNHYQQDVEEGLYPIEVIDIDMMRGTQYYSAGKCHGCFGITTYDTRDHERSELYLDNDFRYTPEYNATKDTIIVDGNKCVYDIANLELTNVAHDYSYADRWEIGIRVSLIHELYHAIQFRYLDLDSYWTFWFEASASGVEELAAPDIDDYFAYLPNMSKSVGKPLDGMIEDYGAGIFLLYLYNHVDRNADKFIWESFAKNPDKTLNIQLEKFANSKNLSMDSLFHDFATRLAFAGNRANFVDSSEWISEDEYNWPEFVRDTNSGKKNFSVTLLPLAYQYNAYGRAELDSFTGKASLAAYKGNVAEIYPIRTTNEGDSLYTAMGMNPSVDSVTWIFSRFGGDILPTVIKDSTIRAYPTPWRHGELCFTPLPLNKKFIEIRNRRGDLITREKYSGYTHCIDENQVKKLMTPGIYRFRAGNSGKTKDFIVIY